MVVGARWAGLTIIETADLLGFSVGFAEKGLKNRKYPVSCSFLGENALLMKFRGKWPDSFEVIERQQ